MKTKLPFKVPPFKSCRGKPEVQYFWWSWHPCYPNWAKSCWGGKTIDEAWGTLSKPFANSMRYYHNKLIREGDGQFTEVANLPCQDIDVWWKIRKQMVEKGIKVNSIKALQIAAIKIRHIPSY